MKFSAHTTGLVSALVLGIWHAIWSLLVALGWAKPLLDFVLGLHFIQFPYAMAPFNLGTAAMLVVVTAAVGYVVGYLSCALWNKLVK